ncbi:uncharacterized protein LOC106647220 [Copidosoma floridanum]|uniref:uncharacterized protein LOC106647220 n=1 Tax=Copidosoma floridanum TaxID=29053 RepID=UPI0006C96CBF|nr:uncharacterized protein LOC106647220 [Copidosoma floridanum]XP_014219011.1 uncharacterized protein LOC106647220 [Copidosoma floridanum]
MMGRKSHPVWLCAWLLLATCVAIVPAEEEDNGGEEKQPKQQNRPKGICALDGCNCSVKAHHWVFVKCNFTDDQDVEISEGMIPEDTIEVEVKHCRELRIQADAFTGGSQLKRVRVSGIDSVVANRQAFQNITAPNPLLEVAKCNQVVLESHAFHNTKGPLSVAISECSNVVIKPNAFFWLLQITVKDVSNLVLSSNSFRFESPQHGRHGPATKIMFQNVMVPVLPEKVFPSTVAEIRMENFWTRAIKKDAFCAMNILSVMLKNASIVEIESGAFSDRTLISSLEFFDVRVKTVHSRAFRAGSNNLTIQYSRLLDVQSGAIDITVASVTFNNNKFHRLHRNSIAFHQWNRIAIDYNIFQYLESEAMVIPIVDTAKSTNLEFSFTSNDIHDAETKSLSFIETSQRVPNARVSSNYFNRTCNCNLQPWIHERVGSNASISWIFDSSYCIVDKLLRNCFDMREGYLGMRNYTQTICTKTSHTINCIYHTNKSETVTTPPNVGPHQYPSHRGYFDIEMSDFEQLKREKLIIIIVCVTAAITLVIAVFTYSCLYIRRRGVCPKLISGQPNLNNSWFSATNGMTAATSARSISRLSVIEYAGLQPETQTRILDIEAHQDAVEENEGAAEGFNASYSENKATQTLPEELTADYLKELKEKLYDPENYNHARAMIEHLYDLINVEESCNNNYERRMSADNDAYDVIRPRVKRSRAERTPSVNVGTKAPSLEKLLPNLVRPRPQLTDYAQPRDQQIIDQNHLYTELPGDETVPSTSRLPQPVLETLAHRAQQLLPPDVVNGHMNGISNGLIYADEDYDDRRLQGAERRAKFFGDSGMTMTGTRKAEGKRPNFSQGEFADPGVLNAHLYAELTEPRQQMSSAASNKMANRPLPTKPDQQDEQIAKT